MLIALIRAMRPKQWAKNVLLFAALVFDRQLGNPTAVLDTLAGFALFSLTASAVYLVNDLRDVEADRQHPTKRNRPIASGALPVPTAKIVAVILPLLILPLAWRLSPAFLTILALYYTLNILYSIWLKHQPIIDVLVLASFYILRVGAGVVLIQVERFSPWLYVAMLFLALFLGIGKRRAELAATEGSGRKVLQFYTLEFLDQLMIIVLTIAIVTYSLYTFSAPNLPENHTMMLTIPFVIYAIFRYLWLVKVGGHGEAPEDLLFSDRPLQADLVLWAATIFVIFYLS
ncbi:MAG: decaprenyl-phosphate phosphoribosyltransferase [Anaerolineae bacterium]|nr:MAG: decaprenyl-phosphate phosphoribosyltransferase [Anaerolineae bacterium]